ncbi:MAG: hypothetical protein JO028_10250 [Acidobacteriaceae bacterium]|nr:hypothetical protein [Acidobacteriaceae bacterium]
MLKRSRERSDRFSKNEVGKTDPGIPGSVGRFCSFENCCRIISKPRIGLSGTALHGAGGVCTYWDHFA